MIPRKWSLSIANEIASKYLAHNAHLPSGFQDVVQLNCSALQDSLEALTLIVEANDEARTAALEASGIEAVTIALQTSSVRKSWAVRLLLALSQGRPYWLSTHLR